MEERRAKQRSVLKRTDIARGVPIRFVGFENRALLTVRSGLAANWLPKLGEMGRSGAKKRTFLRQNRTIFQLVRVSS